MKKVEDINFRRNSPMHNRNVAMDFVRQTNSIFAAVARSLEHQAFEREFNLSVEENLLIQDQYLAIQRMSFRFKALTGRLRAADEFERAVYKTLQDLDQFLQSSRPHRLLNFSMRVPVFRDRTGVDFLHPALRGSARIPIFEALTLMRESLRAVSEDAPYVVNELEDDTEDFETVKRKIPSQKIAPAQFDVENGKLVVVDQASTPKEGLEKTLIQGLESLIDQSNAIISALKSGNYDNRICSHFEKIQEILNSGDNIVHLGLQNITSKAMTAAFSDELPSAVVAQMEGYSAGIAMYVAQFEDWQTFVQNAAEAMINDDVSSSMNTFLVDLNSEFEKYSEVVDPEVPNTIKFLAELISDPARTTKRSLFAFVRTIENLISKAFGYIIDLFSKTAEKSVEKLSDAASSVITRALIGIGVVSALGIMPVMNGVSGMEWIESAFRLVTEKIGPQIGIF